MSHTRSPSFVSEIPLRVSPAQEKALLKRLDVARQVYNACLGESLKRLALLHQSKVYQAARKLPRGKARADAFKQANKAVGFREYDLHGYAAQFNHCWLGEHLDINTIQKLATRAFGAVQQHAFGKRGKPRFKGKNQFDSVEGKSNASGIRWRDDKIAWLELSLEAIADPEDAVVAHGLNCPIKYVRLVRRKINGRNRFYAQLVCRGNPYQKTKNKTGHGIVGIDIGPSTIAAVHPDHAFLEQFCAELKTRLRTIRLLQRKLDRQRRASNPENYNPNGTVKKGVKHWRKSRRYMHTQIEIAKLKRKQAAHRKSLHGRMVNRILRMGDTFKLEKLSYWAFQRQYGRSVNMRAPGMFVERLKCKVESAGATVLEFPTRTTRLSQTCQCGVVMKKPLSQRWHKCDCGVTAQRDLYSAFLALCVEGERLNAAYARSVWARMDCVLQAALSRIQPASSGHLPASFGISRSQSRSLAKSGREIVKAQDVVPSVLYGVRESLRETVSDARTPRL